MTKPNDQAPLMGINVASDRAHGLSYADLIVDGHKALESRNSDTLRPYVGKRVAIVRTGAGPAKAIGEVTIGQPMVVNKKKFRSMEDQHLVPEGSAFDITTPTKHLYPMHDPVRYEKEKDVGHGIIARKVINMAKGGKVEVRPTVFDDAASRRNPKIEEAALALMKGELKQKAYAKLVAKEKPVKAYDFIPKPATDEQAMDVLLDRQKQNWKSHNNWPAGRRVGLRLDIPAYERYGVWVNSVHDEEGSGEHKLPNSYGPVSSVRNATFEGSPDKAVRVATGEQRKNSFARIKGNLEHINEEDAIKHFQKYMNHPDYRQVGYDPRRHGDFYDRETMQPITHSEHVVQIGPLVLAKNPKYGKPTLYAKGGVAHMDKGGRPPQQTNLDMAREAAERVGQHHDPLTRSLQQGYEHGWYHGSTGDIKAFDPNTRGESTGAASAKKGYFFARDPSTPPPEMLEHDPESLAMLQRIGATIPPKPTMAGHGAHTASSYAGTGGSREYKEAMRMAKAAERVGNWDAYHKYMQMAEDAEINNMRYRQDLVAKHGDARDTMYEHIKNAWYGAHNAELFKGMSQPDYEAHDKRYKELMPYGWHIDYEKPHYEALKAQIKKFGNNKQVQSALDAIDRYQSVHNERRAADVESGANVMPVALRYKNPMYHDFKGSSYRDQTYSDLMDQAMRGGHDALILKNTYDPGGTGKPKMVDVGVVFHPNQIRSKFAAFDPTRTKESDLLAKRGGRVTHAHHLEIEERPL